MPTRTQSRDASSPRSPETRLIPRVRSLLERPAPWPEALIEEARDAVLELAERLGRLNGLAGGPGGVEMSPELLGNPHH